MKELCLLRTTLDFTVHAKITVCCHKDLSQEIRGSLNMCVGFTPLIFYLSYLLQDSLGIQDNLIFTGGMFLIPEIFSIILGNYRIYFCTFPIVYRKQTPLVSFRKIKYTYLISEQRKGKTSSDQNALGEKHLPHLCSCASV